MILKKLNHKQKARPDPVYVSSSNSSILSALRDEQNELAGQASHQAVVPFDQITDPEIKKLFESNAIQLTELGRYFLAIDCDDWFERLIKLPLERLNLIINQIEPTKALVTAIADMYIAPLDFLETTEIKHLNLFITNSQSVIIIIKNLSQLRASFVSMLLLDIDKLELLLSHHVEAIELSYALLEPCARPFETLMGSTLETLQLLFTYCPNVIDLIKNQEKHYDFFTTLIKLDKPAFELLCNYHQQAISIMDSLYNRGVLAPLEYLCQVGSERMLAIFTDVDNCVQRINEGYDLKNPELPKKSREELFMESLMLAEEYFGNSLRSISPR